MKHVNINNNKNRTSIMHNDSYEGERIETKIERILTNNEPIKDGAPLIYTERKDGIKPEFDIRTDRFEIAIDAMDVVSRSHRGRRESKVIPMDRGKETNDFGGAEPIQATNEGK